MKQIFYKEILYGIRNQKFFILMIVFVLLAIMTPLMMKYILPELLFKNMMGLTELEIEDILDLTQKGVFASFLSDFLEIGTLVVCILLAPLIPSEYRQKTVLFTRLYDIKTKHQVLIKWVLYGLYVFLMGTISIFICYTYTGVMFEFEISFNYLLRLIIFYGFFMSFVVSLLILIGSYMKKSVSTMIMTYALVMILFGIGNLLKIDMYMPTGLMNLMAVTNELDVMDYFIPAISSILVTILALVLAIKKIEHIDLESLGQKYA
ncbi:MAG: hypothetical protein WC219_01355 [Acholeplasmataceae bacterium]